MTAADYFRAHAAHTERIYRMSVGAAFYKAWNRLDAMKRPRFYRDGIIRDLIRSRQRIRNRPLIRQ
jgi:hypothetical protein